jgi:transcriptional regulator with XRE-family HTH domain
MTTTFSSRLRLERARLGLTQEQFASLGGVKRASQHMYEQSERVPDIHYLQRLSEHQIDVVHLLLGQKVPSSSVGQLILSGSLLSDIYSVVDEFGCDIHGDLLPLRDRLKLFQFLCAAVAGPDSQINAQGLRERLSQFSGR